VVALIRLYDGPSEFFRHRAALDDSAPGVRPRVEAILDRVRRGGDGALVELTSELDDVDLDRETLLVSPEEIATSARSASSAFRRVLESAARNIRRYHERQIQTGFEIDLEDGSRLGQRVRPLESVGVYVPGGEACYPSTVLMNVIPARIAGVPRIVAFTPPGALERSPELAAAFELLSLGEIYRVGGAQAVAAMAFGTESIRPVDKIVGPGNAYVAEAKRIVFGRVGIDAVAGPSEIVVLADETADSRYVAADLLSQAEHGSGDESAILVTTSRPLAERVSRELALQAATLPRKEGLERVLRDNGALIVVRDLDEALETVDRIAPEHLEIMTADAGSVSERVKNAGAIFVGDSSPVPVGDFYAGPNHVLPTGTTARFASPLGVLDFVKRSSLVHYSRARLARDREDIEAFARAEGFEAHARAISIRFDT
jgi:histidinol dehydrogenase